MKFFLTCLSTALYVLFFAPYSNALNVKTYIQSQKTNTISYKAGQKAVIGNLLLFKDCTTPGQKAKIILSLEKEETQKTVSGTLNNSGNYGEKHKAKFEPKNFKLSAKQPSQVISITSDFCNDVEILSVYEGQ